jgi:hypothetical protein
LLLVPTAACGSDDKKGSDDPKPDPTVSVGVDNDSGKLALPDGMSAGVVVYDREKNKVVVKSGEDVKFRTTSITKLLLAIDYLKTTAPSKLDDATRSQLNAMLSSNEDNLTTKLYRQGGKDQYVQRLANELKLNHTSQPAENSSGWGSWLTTASDVVAIYQYILGDYAKSNAEASKFILEALSKSSKCASDGFNQAFGIPTLKDDNKKSLQGWYQFPSTPATGGCDGNSAVEYEVNEDLDREYLHSTGLVGKDDRSIVVVLTAHAKGTNYATASARVNNLTSGLKLTA